VSTFIVRINHYSISVVINIDREPILERTPPSLSWGLWVEATATFSLLRLILERHGPDGGAPGSPVRDLFDRLRGKWDGYNAA
jgi:hypothetical protein